MKSAAWLATGLALLLTLLKALAWWYTGSVSILASLVDSVLDLLASASNLIAIRYALIPADDNHRFGHGKAESLAALGQGLLIIISAGFLLLSAAQKLTNPEPLLTPEYGIYVSIFSAIMVVFLVAYQRKVIKLTNSVAIKADSLHYETDLLVNIIILIALVLSWQGLHWADPLFAFGLGCYILYSAVQLIKEACNTLLDKQLPEEEIFQIEQAALKVPNIKGVHDIKTRKSGMTRFIQLHIELDDEMPLLEAHQIADLVELSIQNTLLASEVIVHIEPYSIVNKA